MFGKNKRTIRALQERIDVLEDAIKRNECCGVCGKLIMSGTYHYTLYEFASPQVEIYTFKTAHTDDKEKNICEECANNPSFVRETVIARYNMAKINELKIDRDEWKQRAEKCETKLNKPKRKTKKKKRA